MNVLAGLIVIAGLIAWYQYSLRRYPYRRCPHCGGRGTRSDPVTRSNYGNCHACRDRRVIRIGVRIFTPKTYAAIRAGKRGRNF